MRLANLNAALWAVGNGLVSSLLVIYLAADLGAEGIGVSLILAAPRFAGVLRLAVPALIARLKSRKWVCIAAYLISSAILCAVPIAALVRHEENQTTAITVLVIAWCAYHLAEFVGTIALWSWLGDLTPRRIRGRLLGERERWLVAGRIGGIAASAALAVGWKWFLPDAARWQPLALSAAVGDLLMLAAVVPLVWMPAVEYAPSARPKAPWRTLGRALVDPAYARLIGFSCWFSLVNGITAAAQELYPVRVLDISYTARQLLQGMMRAGQWSIAPSMGRLVDRWGNRPLMFISQLITATGPLFFLMATPERPWLVAGAFVVWIAYAGLNVGIDNIKLKLSPPDNNAPYLAVYHAASDVMNGVATVGGGILMDQLFAGGSGALRLYSMLFIAGWLGRTAAVALVATLIEPGAKRLRELI
jgi:MFS family permease